MGLGGFSIALLRCIQKRNEVFDFEVLPAGEAGI